jgi:hypothetical protein
MPESAVIPPPGTVEIQITNMSPAGVAAYLGPQAGSQTPLQLLGYFRRPQGATHVVRSVAPHRVTIAGIAAERDAYAYVYEGRRDVQTQLALRKGATVISVEVDAAPAIEPTAISALNVVLAHWVWYGPAHPAPAAPTLPTPPAVATGPSPTGQWIATGTVSQSYHVPGRAVGARLIRAWIFRRVCKAGVGCHTDFVLQITDGSVIQTVLVPERNGTFRAVFPATVTPCENGGSGQDHYSMDMTWLPGHRLVGTSVESFSGGCTPGAFDQAGWTVSRVGEPAAPPLAILSRRSATVGAFRAAAQRACTTVNAQALPLAAKLASLEHAAGSATSRAVRADSESRIAELLGAVLPLSVKQYTEIPQPPAGALDALWLQDITDIRRQLKPAAAMIAALQTAAQSASQYFRTSDPLDAQRLLTTPSLISDDALAIAGAGDASNAIERKLGLPSICINEPAIASIFSSGTTLAT